MDNNEALEKLRAYLKCQENKVKDINALCNHNLCDDCDLCYMQGTVGEHIEAIEVATQALEKLKAYKDLEEQSRLVKLPCKVGDTVYGISMGKIINLTVNEISIFCMKGEKIINVKCQSNDEFRNYVEREFGKTVFLTKEEAGAKLKELRGEENGN